MSQLSDYLENALINAVLRNTTYTSPTTVYAALFGTTASTANLEASTLTGELTDGTPARQAITFSAPSGGATSNSGNLDFAFTASETIRYVAIMDASTAGNVLWHAQLAGDVSMVNGETFRIATGDLDVTLA